MNALACGHERHAHAANGWRGGQPLVARHPRPVWGPPARDVGLPIAPAVRGRVCAHVGPYEYAH